MAISRSSVAKQIAKPGTKKKKPKKGKRNGKGN